VLWYPYNFSLKFGKEATAQQYKSVLPCIRDPLFLKQIRWAKRSLLYTEKRLYFASNVVMGYHNTFPRTSVFIISIVLKCKEANFSIRAVAVAQWSLVQRSVQPLAVLEHYFYFWHRKEIKKQVFLGNHGLNSLHRPGFTSLPGPKIFWMQKRFICTTSVYFNHLCLIFKSNLDSNFETILVLPVTLLRTETLSGHKKEVYLLTKDFRSVDGLTLMSYWSKALTSQNIFGKGIRIKEH